MDKHHLFRDFSAKKYIYQTLYNYNMQIHIPAKKSPRGKHTQRLIVVHIDCSTHQLHNHVSNACNGQRYLFINIKQLYTPRCSKPEPKRYKCTMLSIMQFCITYEGTHAMQKKSGQFLQRNVLLPIYICRHHLK